MQQGLSTGVLNYSASKEFQETLYARFSAHLGIQQCSNIQVHVTAELRKPRINLSLNPIPQKGTSVGVLIVLIGSDSHYTIFIIWTPQEI